MQRRATFPALILIILAAIAASTQSSSAVVPDQGPSAFGEGEFSLPTDFGTEHWSFSFDTGANKNGHARGRATFDILQNSVQTQVIVKINCLDVSGTSGLATAIMTGTVLHSDDPEFPKRANVLFAAVDSSGAPIPSSDIITRLFVFEGGDCHSGAFPLTLSFLSPDAIHIEP
jgi:hypothetical protein